MSEDHEEKALLRRVGKHAGILLSAKGVAGVLSLVYLAIAARALGVEGLGVLALIKAYVGTVLTLCRMPIDAAMVRYGSGYTEIGRVGQFQSLLKLLLVFRVFLALAAPVVTVVSAPHLGPLVGIPPEAVWLIVVAGISIPLFSGDLGVGILRLYDRVGLIARIMVGNSIVRVAGVLIVWWAGGGLPGFVAVWIATSAVGGLLFFHFARRELVARGLLDGMDWSLRGVARDHRRIWSFLINGSLAGDMGLVTGQLTTMLVGAALDPSAAGLLRVARKATSIVGKPIGSLKIAMMPELARLRARESYQVYGRLVWQALRLGALVGLPVLLIYVLLGKPALKLALGPEFVAAYAAMVVFAANRMIGLSSFALSSAIRAAGKMAQGLRISLFTNGLYLAVLYFFLDDLGIMAVAYGILLNGLVTAGLNAALVHRYLRRQSRKQAARAAEPRPLAG